MQVFAGDAHAAIALGANGVDDRVVVGADVVVAEVGAEVNVAEEAEGGHGGDLVVDARHRLDLLVVGGHAVAHEAEGRGLAVVHIHRHRHGAVLQ